VQLRGGYDERVCAERPEWRSRAGVEGHVRPFHDLRHTAITNDAASGNSPMAIVKRAGHSNFKTTQGYIDLAGEMFREEGRLFGGTGTRNGYKESNASPEMTTTEV
jgi:integrase